MIHLPNFDLLTFSKLVLEAVKYYPQLELSCHVPKTYAMLENITDLDADNLGKTLRDADLTYYNKKFINGKKASHITKDYPLVVLHSLSWAPEHPFKKNKAGTHFLELFVMDTYDAAYVQKPGGTSKCKNRTIEEIRRDCKGILMNILIYLSECAYFATDDGPVWTHEGRSSQLTNPVLDQVTTDGFRSYLKDLNPTPFGEPVNISVDDSYGYLINIRVKETECKSVTFDFEQGSGNKQADTTY